MITEYTSSNGRRIPIKDMVDSHLVNAVLKIEREARGADPRRASLVYDPLRLELEARPAARELYQKLRGAAG